jgi:hypothetical protein
MGMGYFWTTFFNIEYHKFLNLKLKLYIVFDSWTEKLGFSFVANILNISVLGFFASRFFSFKSKYSQNVPFMLYKM